MTVPKSIANYSELWFAIKAEFLRHESAIKELQAQEHEAFPDRESYNMITRYGHNYDIEGKLREKARDLFQSVIWAAEKEFAGDAGRLQIDAFKLREKHLREDRDSHEKREYLQFDPVALWRDLEAEYGGDKGAELGWKQAASDLIKAFSLRDGMQVKTVGASVVLEQNTWLDSWNGSYSYNCMEEMGRVTKALLAFAGWAGDHELQHVIRFSRDLKSLNDFHRKVTSREKFVIGKGLEAITFKNKIEWRFGGEMGAKFQAFISTFGTLLPAR